MNSCLEISPIDDQLLPNQSTKTQLVQMMVEVKTEGDVKTIGGFLDQIRDMLDKLVKSQKKHVEIHAKMMKQCIEEDLYRSKEIAVAKDALKRGLAARNRCSASLKAAVRELPLLQWSLKTYVKELKRATVQRDVENKKYNERRDALKDAINFIREFIEFIRKKAGSGYKAFALAELSETLLKHSAKLNVMTEAVPVLVAIASERKASDYTYRANQGLAGRLKDTLTELVNRIKKDSDTNDANERSAQAAFKKYAARLNKVIATLRKNIKRVKKQIVDMTRCIDHESKIIKTASLKLARNTQLRNNAANMCRSFNKEFIEATYNRLNEIKTMNEIMVIISRRFKELPNDLVAYLERVKDGWIKYVNSTEFKKFKEYERKKYTTTKRGALLARSEADKVHNPIAAVIKGKHGIY
jgi:hypothetical protein